MQRPGKELSKQEEHKDRDSGEHMVIRRRPDDGKATGVAEAKGVRGRGQGGCSPGRSLGAVGRKCVEKPLEGVN